MAKKPETEFKNQKVIPFLKSLKNCWYTVIQQKSIRGTPDILLCVKGYFIAMELKKDEKAPIALIQSHTLELIRNANGMGMVVFPECWDAAQDLLTYYDEGNEED